MRNDELLDYIFELRVKAAKGVLSGTDLNMWFLEALSKWLNDYILLAEKKLEAHTWMANKIRNRIESLKKKEIVVGSDVTLEMVDIIIFLMLEWRSQ